MKVYLNRIDGWDDAIISMFLSKRTLTRELEQKIRKVVYENTCHDPSEGVIGQIKSPYSRELAEWLNTFFKWSRQHITLGRFLDFSFSVYGMHRGAQDDFDSHAKRLENRIIRSSTRLADYNAGEVSDFYVGKIIPTDTALAVLGLTVPKEIEYEGKTYVKGVNGYILKGMEHSKDVKRGLYMLSIPSSFVFKCNLTEYAHIYKERNEQGAAAPELKLGVEDMTDQLQYNSRGYVTRDLLRGINN